MILYRAELISRNFHFEAVDFTAAAAQSALIMGLEKHARQYGLDDRWWREIADDIRMTPYQVGRALRDRELL
jgi:hypothetical protein